MHQHIKHIHNLAHEHDSFYLNIFNNYKILILMNILRQEFDKRIKEYK